MGGSQSTSAPTTPTQMHRNVGGPAAALPANDRTASNHTLTRSGASAYSGNQRAGLSRTLPAASKQPTPHMHRQDSCRRRSVERSPSMGASRAPPRVPSLQRGGGYPPSHTSASYMHGGYLPPSHQMHYNSTMPGRFYQNSPASAHSSSNYSPVSVASTQGSFKSSSGRMAHQSSMDAGGKAYPKGTCDKCDGPHLTDSCPIYKKAKEDHPDAWRNFGRKTPLGMGASGGNFKLKNARVVRQPGDGSCLFHSLSYGLGSTNASTLRRQIADFVSANPKLEIAETPMNDWVKWDSGTSVQQYASKMAVSGWGGGIEMAACSHLKKVNVHVYEKTLFGNYKRISCFDVPNARQTLHVLYRGGVHYDALVPGG
mmetsp:Transcript_8200/g.20359  ORF Transcript_8200/g.20359 Transcript_8200/m.20359 type:complete len:370 (+) Transcript_8200:214-1323(+)